MKKKKDELPALIFDVTEYHNALSIKKLTPLETEQASMIKLVFCRENEWPYKASVTDTIWLYDTSKKTDNTRPLAFAMRDLRAV